MSSFQSFMKQNKAKKENTQYVATKSLSDDEGKPLLWEIKHVSTKENEDIREACMKEVPILGKTNVFRPKLNTNQYILQMVVASVVFPNLYDAALQDSYSVKTPGALLQELVDDPGEYQDFATFVQNFNGFNTSMQDKVDEAKNS